MYKQIVTLLLLKSVSVLSNHSCSRLNLRADCSLKKLKYVPQTIFQFISHLDLSFNQITRLENNVFERYQDLISLSLDNNKLNFLDENVFKGLGKLQNLSMANNHLRIPTSYTYNVFEPLIGLRTLDLRYNVQKSDSKVTQYMFLGSLESLVTLSIDLSSNPDFEKCGLTSIKTLQKVTFDNCFIDSLMNTTFQHFPDSVLEIDFKNCNFIRIVQTEALLPFRNLHSLRFHQSRMELSSAMKLLYPFENRKMNIVEFIRINPGYVQSMNFPFAVIVTRAMMKHIQNICLKVLILADNGIVDFEPDSLLSYKYPECLERIVLSGNRFSLFNSFKLKELFLLSPRLTNLTLFDLSYNPLTYGEDAKHKIKLPCDAAFSKYGTCDENGEITEMMHTPQADILKTDSDNNTNHMSAPIFYLPPKLEILRFTHVLSGPLTNLNKIVLLNSSNLKYVDVAFNYVPEISLDASSNIYYIDFSGIFSWRRSQSLFTNARVVHLRYSGIWTTIQETPRFFEFIPHVEKLEISVNNLWQLTSDTFSQNKNLTHLIMRSNLFDSLPTAILAIPKLTVLDVTNNILDTINETIRNWIDMQQKKMGTFKLFLQGNIFYCTCDNADFVKWLYTTDVIFDHANREYRCMLSNGSVTTTTVVYNDFHKYFGNCKNGLWLRVGITLLVSFVVITIPVALILNFKWQIAYWIYRKFRKVIEDDLKDKFKYDIYLSYSRDSLIWVKNVLVPRIEQSWELTMCVEDRDLLAGEIYVDAITESIKQSRHVLFIITDEFSKGDWSKFEIERAKYEKYAHKLQQIIVIAKQVSVENFPSGLDHVWKDVTLIEWRNEEGEESNWDKLRITLFSEFL